MRSPLALAAVFVVSSTPASSAHADAVLTCEALFRLVDGSDGPSTDFVSPLIALEKSPSTTAADGRVLVPIDLSYEKPGTRVIELPAIVDQLKNVKGLKAVVLAGNSGPEYKSTRHSLSHRFLDFLMRVSKATTTADGAPVAKVERVSVTYDDSTSRTWNETFLTEAPLYRTQSGEVFFFKDVAGSPVLVIKMLGDYNEVGDFAVSITDFLKIPPSRTLLLHDDFTTPQGQVGLQIGKPQRYTGNNAMLSMIRTLSYKAVDDVVNYLAIKAYKDYGYLPDRQKLTDLKTQFRSLADVRTERHLGQAKLRPFEDAMAMAKVFRPFIENDMVVQERAKVKTLKAELGQMRQALGPLQARLKDKSLAADVRAQVKAESDQIIASTQPLADHLKAAEDRLQQAIDGHTQAVTEIFERRLAFSRLMIGTETPAIKQAFADKKEGKQNDFDVANFVLSPPEPGAFGTREWVEALRALHHWSRSTSGPTSSP